MSVVNCFNSLTSSSFPVLLLLSHLVLRCLEFNIWFCAKPGENNKVADALSRFCWQVFWELLLEAALEGLRCPQILWDLVAQD